MFCRHCGKELPDDADFCSKCGKSTATAPQGAPYHPRPETPYVMPTYTKAFKFKPLFRDRFTKPVIITIVVCVLVALSIFLPYISATDYYADQLDRVGKQRVLGDLRANDLIHVSLFELIEVADFVAEQSNDYDNEMKVVPRSIYGILILSVVAAFFAIYSKPLVTVLSGLAVLCIGLDISSGLEKSDIFASNLYDPGISYGLLPLAAAGVIACGIWMIIETKKQVKY